jgi:PAS domain S-box-containing protein
MPIGSGFLSRSLSWSGSLPSSRFEGELGSFPCGVPLTAAGHGGSVCEPESETGAGEEPPTAVDKALLGGSPQLVGSFEYRYDTASWTWSDTVARIHGYEPGQVQPTTELILSHKHPDDLAQVTARLTQSQAPFSGRHRIRTTTGEIRTVVVVGQAVADASGSVVATRGVYVDVTEAVAAEVRREVGEELRDIVADRAIIEQAKGMLMVIYDLSDQRAFDLLRWRSQEMNIKLRDIANRLVAKLPPLLAGQGEQRRRPVDHFLMTLDEIH